MQAPPSYEEAHETLLRSTIPDKTCTPYRTVQYLRLFEWGQSAIDKPYSHLATFHALRPVVGIVILSHVFTPEDTARMPYVHMSVQGVHMSSFTST
jgi:hypothetical protein